MAKKDLTAEQISEKKQRKKKRCKIFRRILCVLLCVIVVFIASTTVATIVTSKNNIKKIDSFNAVSNDDALVPQLEEDGNWCFTSDRPLKILQLTDIHIGGGWMSYKKDAMALNAVAAMVTAEKPDLVIATGDIAYPVPFQAGTFNNKTSAKIFAALMEKLGVYWTLSFGNHDTEAYSYYSREKIADFYKTNGGKNCLFTDGPADVDGNCNQVIKIKNSSGVITQGIFVFDSHSYTDGDVLGILWKYDNIHDNQVEWYRKSVNALNEENNALFKKNGTKEKSDVKSLAFFHIPLPEQREAWYEYRDNGYKDTENVKHIYGVAGETGKVVFSGEHEDGLFEAMEELGSTKGIFVGHDHSNNFSVYYKGIRMTYGMSVDYLAYPGISKLGSQRGCTVIEVSPDGSFDCHSENYYQEKYETVFEKEPVTMQEVTYAEQ